VPDRQLLEVRQLARFLLLRVVVLVALAISIGVIGARVVRLELEVDALRACACPPLAYACEAVDDDAGAPETPE